MPECVQNIPECERAYPQVWSNVVRQELVGGHRKGLLLCKLLLPKILPFVIIIHPSIIILPNAHYFCHNYQAHQYRRHHCRCGRNIPPDQNKKARIVSIIYKVYYIC